MKDFLNQDNGNLLEDGNPKTRKGNMHFRWINLTNSMAEDLLLCDVPPGEKGDPGLRVIEDLKHETPSTLLECGTVTDPLFEELGYWGMINDFPLKMSG